MTPQIILTMLLPDGIQSTISTLHGKIVFAYPLSNNMAKSSTRKNSSKKSSRKTTYTGTLDVSKSGVGFVIVDQLDKDILVKPNHFGMAFHGDKVRVQVNTSDHAGKRMEGVITEVVERKHSSFMGRIQINRNIAFFESGGDRFLPDFFIAPDKLHGAVDGDRVVVKLLRWDKTQRKPEGEVVSVISGKDEADLAMKEILLEAGFDIGFEAALLQEAEALSGRITREEERKRRDFRDILTFTIDPVDAKDFDDAISIRNLDNGNYEIGVHIADVSHFVKPGTALDQEAFKRATSVYLPDRVNPMLPEKISNELCSLRPQEEKYTFAAVFQITNRAEIKHTWIGRTIICSDHRYTYEDVQEIIESGDGLHRGAILLLNKLAQQFRKNRFDNGAINFSSTEVRFKLDDHGKPLGIVVKESKESHQLIEEFMLLANRAVAEFVSKFKIDKQPIPFPYRIHDTPDEEKLKPFAAFAGKFGYKLNINDEADVAASFNQLLNEVQGKPEQHVLEQLGIRTMAKAVYTSENIGHYGLGFVNYCHFTSPIRRYPDVIAHRILQDCLDKQLKLEKKMEDWCKHCSERERAATEAERAGNKYKQVEFMKDYLGDVFDGVISGVAPFGFWVETVEHKCEGLISIRDLSDIDDFRHDDTDYALVGKRTKKRFRMGDSVKIRVIAANLTKRQLDYGLVLNK